MNLDLNLIATPRHVGQGASQALEDAGYLSHLLQQLPSICGPGTPTSEELVSVFSAFQKARQPRTKQIMTEAHRQGNLQRECSAIWHFVKIWILKVMCILTFVTEIWMDEWYGYQVPGLEDWSD